MLSQDPPHFTFLFLPLHTHTSVLFHSLSHRNPASSCLQPSTWAFLSFLALSSPATVLVGNGAEEKARALRSSWGGEEQSPHGVQSNSSTYFFKKQPDLWDGLPFPPPGDLPDTGIKPESPASPALQADSLPLSHRGSPQTAYTHPVVE